MFTILYSGADNDAKQQNDSSKSLGGYISSSMVPNNAINNVFPAVTRRHLKDQLIDVRLIVLKNDSVPLSSVRIWTEKGTLANFKIAAVAPAIDSCSKAVFEQLVDGHSIPYQASLASHETVTNALVIGSVSANQIIGLWIERDVDESQFNELDGIQGIEALSNDDLQILLENNPISVKVYDQPLIIIDWA